MIRALVVGLGLLLVGCASAPSGPAWVRQPGQPPANLDADDYECRARHTDTARYVRRHPIWGGAERLDADLYRACLRAKGWEPAR